MTPKRKFYRKGLQHVFQISVDRGIIFYTDADFIVFFTLLCCFSVKYHIRIVSLCIMKNHFHILGYFGSPVNMELFINAVCSVYARMYNKRYHRKGKLFKKPFGSAPKYKESDIYDCMIYINNNPVPKRAAEHAIDYRWNFLAYMDSKFPFSDAFDFASAPDNMISKYLEIVRAHDSGLYIDYTLFDELVLGLNDKQHQQIMDMIVSIYNVIDYRVMLSKWLSKESVSGILDLVKGSEYDLKEDSSQEDYKEYDKMNQIAGKMGFDLSRIRFDSEGVDRSFVDKVRNNCIYSFNPSSMELDKYFHTGEFSRTLPRKTP